MLFNHDYVARHGAPPNASPPASPGMGYIYIEREREIDR